MKGYLFCLFLFPVSLIARQDTIRLPLSGTMVNLVSFGEDSSDILLYNMHDNENTSALAGRMLGEIKGGTYYELMHNGKRNISFLFGEDSIHIDPNRIYTDTGIWLQLNKNKITDTTVHRMIAVWRDSLLNVLQIEKRSLVIALHNNTNQYYSFKSYRPDGEYESEAHAVSKGCIRDVDDFYFVTDHTILHGLAVGQYHVILQDNETMTDDGSLSVYCARYDIPYVNVEAQHGHLFRQVSMLLFVYQQILKQSGTVN